VPTAAIRCYDVPPNRPLMGRVVKPHAAAASAFPVSYSIFRLARAHRSYAAELLRTLDLYPGQELILMSLRENGPQNQAQLVEIEQTDHSTIAKSVRRMEDAGLVTRRRSEEDRRATIVSLTSKGKAVYKKIEAAWTELERVTVAQLDRNQRDQLLHAMRIVETSIPRR